THPRGLGRWRRPSRAAADTTADPGTAAAGRPARLGAVVTAVGAPRGAARPPRPRAAPARQPDLRWLLLVSLGGEHPGGQGLHLRRALYSGALHRGVSAHP